ncbi:N-acetylmannosamine-6-phosphate 2-epimerase [Massilia eurypsychrophila]|jgi:N-acylglucosamine-6-phosphate 2-epimerase|uniref:Putative N-acetylmannosamine-6-phosphate 2-epimerase n=1 Tax=Massilia eurypsychrophila TaxID=1485217 RepID=A0A2G8T8T2_9BURK|nr:N-acetylmannosamine-6-phosphate 2-epimerase [Massilia eurypsychrophila]PIL42460.1 N-acetylmannosamine-6-phosphate 2-epimerase [Massilia eurypsychrophila]
MTRRRAFDTLAALDRQMAARLVVSCQPIDDGPLDRHDIVARFAMAAVVGGAGAIRIEGAERLAAVRSQVNVPIIGIVKYDLDDSPVRITPFIADVDALIAAGADIVAVDATARPRPVALADLLAAIRAGGAWAMADCSCEEDALAAHALGFDIIGTTLSGYTGGAVPDAADFDLIAALAAQVPRVMAEGRIHTPADVVLARAAGAWAVTVGTAITRTELVTQWFAAAMTAAPAHASPAR